MITLQTLFYLVYYIYTLPINWIKDVTPELEKETRYYTKFLLLGPIC